MNYILMLKVVSLFVAITYSTVVIMRVCYGQSVGQTQTFLMAGGITGFVCLQWLI